MERIKPFVAGSIMRPMHRTGRTTLRNERKGRGRRLRRGGSGGVSLALSALLLAGVTACASGSTLPQTRSVITLTGERVQADPEAMVEVDRWLRPQLDDIERNWTIRLVEVPRPLYPWAELELSETGGEIAVQRGFGDAETPYLLYAHFHLMAERGELAPWLPEAPEARGFELERAILARIADVWLLGRAVFDTTPFGPLDEILYANEFGFLDAFILTAQPDRFEEERTAWTRDNPGRAEEFRDWFRRTFEADGPRFIPTNDSGAEPTR